MQKRGVKDVVRKSPGNNWRIYFENNDYRRGIVNYNILFKFYMHESLIILSFAIAFSVYFSFFAIFVQTTTIFSFLFFDISGEKTYFSKDLLLLFHPFLSILKRRRLKFHCSPGPPTRDTKAKNRNGWRRRSCISGIACSSIL